jgi:hypothetical protein
VLGYLPVDVLDQKDFKVEAFGEQSRASIVDGAIYDPKRKKILC